MLGTVAVGVVRESRKFTWHHVYGALRGHLCDSTAFLHLLTDELWWSVFMLRCEVIGGGSTVDVRLYLHDDDVTSGFSVTRSRTTVGARCMRRERYVTARWSDEFIVRAEHDGMLINCSVVLPPFPLPVASQSAMLTVRCKRSDFVFYAQYRPPTPTRRNCRVESRRRCVLGFIYTMTVFVMVTNKNSDA